MARKALLGHKVRSLRRDNELSQVELARRLGISASYLNLIEHNQRPLTLPLLLKLADSFDVDLQDFSQDREARLLGELQELFGDPLFQGVDLGEEELRTLVASAPAASQGLLALYRAYRGAREDLQALVERLSDSAFLSTSSHELRTLLTTIRSFSEILQDHENIDPERRRRFAAILAAESARLTVVVERMLDYAHEEGAGQRPAAERPEEAVTDFIQAHDNHFPALEDAAADLRRDWKLGESLSERELIELLQERYGQCAQLRPAGSPPVSAATDMAPETLLLDEADPPATRRFRLAGALAEAACATTLAELAESEFLASETAVLLGRRALAGYLAGALLMPYEAFLEAARSLRYDIALLQRRFGASFEQVCHRLSSLQRLGERGVPFHFLRVDIAGNVSKRFSASGLSIARYAGVCPRWLVHAAFLTPGRIGVQLSSLPDGTLYFDIACALRKQGGGYAAPSGWLAIGLGCERRHADALVYSDGLDLDGASAAMPIGVTCRLCPRQDCRQRAESPILPSLRNA